MHAYKITVKGLVQGVGFRYYCYKEAEVYGIKGYVQNLINGDVEIFAEGDDGIINDFIESVKRGPRYSRVNSINIVEIKYENKYDTFSIY